MWEEKKRRKKKNACQQKFIASPPTHITLGGKGHGDISIKTAKAPYIPLPNSLKKYDIN